MSSRSSLQRRGCSGNAEMDSTCIREAEARRKRDLAPLLELRHVGLRHVHAPRDLPLGKMRFLDDRREKGCRLDFRTNLGQHFFITGLRADRRKVRIRFGLPFVILFLGHSPSSFLMLFAFSISRRGICSVRFEYPERWSYRRRSSRVSRMVLPGMSCGSVTAPMISEYLSGVKRKNGSPPRARFALGRGGLVDGAPQPRMAPIEKSPAATLRPGPRRAC